MSNSTKLYNNGAAMNNYDRPVVVSMSPSGLSSLFLQEMKIIISFVKQVSDNNLQSNQLQQKNNCKKKV